MAFGVRDVVSMNYYQASSLIVQKRFCIYVGIGSGGAIGAGMIEFIVLVLSKLLGY